MKQQFFPDGVGVVALVGQHPTRTTHRYSEKIGNSTEFSPLVRINPRLTSARR
ncbi:hypothetical protein PZN02_002982 [Sinorhizobium garamanticum]|uniref:Uncharacterized protein n=1 Tax=Sinorhizobium garamanticum TaxID=680247 RepID=A0ABY8DCH5_9HYPH|nr:hypothetical protein [Sinorhizobium garamanticum]WEX86668.1 hypothetical protein PZN02_002982 [Sinorhizobium garamanticum]